MRQSGRVDRLLAAARALVADNLRVRTRHCHGVELSELITLVEQSVPAEGSEAFDAILTQIEEFATRSDRPHGFVEWLCGLQEGWADLPETIPLSVLLAWRNGYTNHPADGTPIPIRRCEVCRMALPNCAEDGSGNCIAPCPVCGSSRIGHMNLAKWGTFPPMKPSGRA
jgi:hypothetical protein